MYSQVILIVTKCSAIITRENYICRDGTVFSTHRKYITRWSITKFIVEVYFPTSVVLVVLADCNSSTLVQLLQIRVLIYMREPLYILCEGSIDCRSKWSPRSQGNRECISVSRAGGLSYYKAYTYYSNSFFSFYVHTGY